jgi:hypothetical protein
MTRTNAYSIFVVMLRAAALWLFLSTLLSAAVHVASMEAVTGMGMDAFQWVGPGLALLVPLSLAAIVWLFAHRLAHLVMARPGQPVFESDIAPSEWQTLAFSVIGLWFVLTGVLDVVYYFFRWFAIRRMIPGSLGETMYPEDFWVGWVVSGIQVVLGLVVMLGARGLVGWLRRVRYAGAGQMPAP